ncbi:MAG: UbiA family prenyltransferase [Enhydrobacter sp.]
MALSLPSLHDADMAAHTPASGFTDIDLQHWTLRLLPTWARPFGRLSRWDRPIGTWLLLFPCWWSLAMGEMPRTLSQAAELAGWMALFALGALAMRGAGCTWNDIVDRKIDAQVERTRSRPLPSGEVKVTQALSWLGIQLAIGAAVLFKLFHTPSYSETDITGLGFGLSFGASDSTYTRTEIGARFDTTTELDGKPLVMRGRLGWAHDFVNTPGINASFSALPGSSFTVTGTTPPPDSALVSVSAEYTFKPRLTLGTKFDGEFSGQAQSYAGMLTLRYDL